MKKTFFILSILFILGFLSIIYSRTAKRTAVIVDQSGTTTEVKSLSSRSYPSKSSKYYRSYSKLVVITKEFDVLIPVSYLMSIEYIGDGTKKKRIFEVSYYWIGEKKKISGTFVNKSLGGKSDFGKFSISLNELKQLKFNQVSNKISQKEEFQAKGYISLRNGSKLEFGDRIRGKFNKTSTLQRQTTYSYSYKKALPQDTNDRILNQRRYTRARGSQTGFFKSIAFDRGKSRGLIEFKDLKSIEFEDKDNRNIMITLKNGKSTKATINKSNDIRDFEGLVGVSGKGEFYIDRKNIKAIYFN